VTAPIGRSLDSDMTTRTIHGLSACPHAAVAWLLAASATFVLPRPLSGQEGRPPPDVNHFPVSAAVLVDGKFSRCEGIAFNGEGDLYVAGDRSLWRVSRDGAVTKIAELYSRGIPFVTEMPEWKERFQQLFDEIARCR